MSISKTPSELNFRLNHSNSAALQYFLRQATVQFTAFETFTTIMAKGQLAALSSNLTFVGMLAGGPITSGFFGTAALVPTVGSDLMNKRLTGNTDYSSTGISLGLTVASLLVPDPIDKVLGATGIAVGNGTTSFEFEKQKWSFIKNTGF